MKKQREVSSAVEVNLKLHQHIKVICLTLFLFSPVGALAQNVNANFNRYEGNVFTELNSDPKTKELYTKTKNLEVEYSRAIQGVDPENVRQGFSTIGSGHSTMYQHDVDQYKKSQRINEELNKTRQQLSERIVQAGGVEVFTDANQFASSIASDLNKTSGSKVVGFLAGFSSAGHDAGVVNDLNTMQKAAAQYFEMGKGSSYSLINGASADGGINQRFEEAVKDGKFTPAGDKSNFKSYGAVSVNIGEWGGMMKTNKSVYLADSPSEDYEMKSSPKAPSGNPLSLATAAQGGNANVHIMLTEGGRIGLREVMEYLNNHHNPSKKALIHLGVGYDPTNPAKDQGFRGASFLAKYLSSHPEMIDELESKNVKFMAVDAKSGRHYSSIKEYFKSADWKSQLLKFSQASVEIDSDEFKAKKHKIADLEKQAIAESNKDKKKTITSQVSVLKGEVALTENRVSYESLMANYTSEFSKINGYKSGSGIFEKVAKGSALAVESTKRSGVGVTLDPVDAARTATKSAK